MIRFGALLQCLAHKKDQFSDKFRKKQPFFFFTFFPENDKLIRYETLEQKILTRLHNSSPFPTFSFFFELQSLNFKILKPVEGF